MPTMPLYTSPGASTMHRGWGEVESCIVAVVRSTRERVLSRGTFHDKSYVIAGDLHMW